MEWASLAIAFFIGWLVGVATLPTIIGGFAFWQIPDRPGANKRQNSTPPPLPEKEQ